MSSWKKNLLKLNFGWVLTGYVLLVLVLGILIVVYDHPIIVLGGVICLAITMVVFTFFFVQYIGIYRVGVIRVKTHHVSVRHQLRRDLEGSVIKEFLPPGAEVIEDRGTVAVFRLIEWEDCVRSFEGDNNKKVVLPMLSDTETMKITPTSEAEPNPEDHFYLLIQKSAFKYVEVVRVTEAVWDQVQVGQKIALQYLGNGLNEVIVL